MNMGQSDFHGTSATVHHLHPDNFGKSTNHKKCLSGQQTRLVLTRYFGFHLQSVELNITQPYCLP